LDADITEEQEYLNSEATSSKAEVTIHRIVHHAGSSQEHLVRILDWEIDPNSSEIGDDLLFPEASVSAMDHIPDVVCFLIIHNLILK